MVDNLWPSKNTANYRDISVTRLSARDPVSFPSHSREWFSIIVYHERFASFATMACRQKLSAADYCVVLPIHLLYGEGQ